VTVYLYERSSPVHLAEGTTPLSTPDITETPPTLVEREALTAAGDTLGPAPDIYEVAPVIVEREALQPANDNMGGPAFIAPASGQGSTVRGNVIGTQSFTLTPSASSGTGAAIFTATVKGSVTLQAIQPAGAVGSSVVSAAVLSSQTLTPAAASGTGASALGSVTTPITTVYARPAAASATGAATLGNVATFESNIRLTPAPARGSAFIRLGDVIGGTSISPNIGVATATGSSALGGAQTAVWNVKVAPAASTGDGTTVTGGVLESSATVIGLFATGYGGTKGPRQEANTTSRGFLASMGGMMGG
jgi:hypothetical protein